MKPPQHKRKPRILFEGNIGGDPNNPFPLGKIHDKPPEEDWSMKEIKKILRKWYKNHETEMPNEYCLNKINQTITKAKEEERKQFIKAVEKAIILYDKKSESKGMLSTFEIVGILSKLSIKEK
jgi:hypothetical protein